VNLDSWFFVSGPRYPYFWAVNAIEHQARPNIVGWAWTGLGAGIMVLLMAAHRIFYWWPIHPIGYVLCSAGWTHVLWFSIFIAWFVKAVVLRFGASGIYHRFRRFFLGMILGQFAVAGAWACVDSITAKIGARIFWV